MPAPLDLAIVGAGAAGASVAYRMGRLRPGWSISLFESTRRVGGRLLSPRPPGVDGIRAELGGMRFRTSQPNVMGLVDELALEHRPFRTVDDRNLYFLRGTRFTPTDFGDPERIPYRLDRKFLGQTPGDVLVGAFDVAVPGTLSLTAEDWARVKREHMFKSRVLRDWSLGDLLRDIAGDEGYQLIADGFGYSNVFDVRSAADAIPWMLIELRPEEENRTLVEGMEQLPRGLAVRFEAGGGHIELGHRLTALSPAGGSGDEATYTLEFAGQPSVTAKRVVLALPRSALEPLGWPLGGARFRDDLATTLTQLAAKLCLAYEIAWWRESGFGGLRSVTDLPLEKTYYWDRALDDTSTNGALVLASYSDGPYREHWTAQADRRSVPIDRLPHDSPDRWPSYEPPPAMIEDAHRQLKTLHGRDDAPPPYAAAFIDWAWDPAGGAYSMWAPGARSWEVIPRMVQPDPDHAIYVCGESYSESQGWIEGALETSTVVVERLAG